MDRMKESRREEDRREEVCGREHKEEEQNGKGQGRIEWHREFCVGCRACVVACMDQNDIRPEYGEQAFCKVTEEENEGRLFWRFTSCRHCRDPVCAAACPKGCIEKDSKTGMVLLNEEICDGCGRCIEACPLHAISFLKREKDDLSLRVTAGKCDGCTERIFAGMEPACVRACPMKALTMTTIF